MRRQDGQMYDDDDDDDDEEEDERDTRGRPRSAAGGRKLPPLALGEFGAKDNQKKRQTTTTGCQQP